VSKTKSQRSDTPSEPRAHAKGHSTLRAEDARGATPTPLRQADTDTSINITRKPNGGIRALAGLELATCATPPRFAMLSGRDEQPVRYPGESDLTHDCHVAVSALLSELPDDAALWSEYVFMPAGEGNVDIRFRFLVESAIRPYEEAVAEAKCLRDELSVCLRVVADWYSFRLAHLDPREEERWIGSTIDFRPRPRAFATDARQIGFTSDKGTPWTGNGILFAQPATGMTQHTEADAKRPFLLLQSTQRATLSSCIKASRGLPNPLVVRIGLRRETLDSRALSVIRKFAGSLSATVREASAKGKEPLMTGLGGEAALSAVNDLLIQPDCFSLHVHAVGELSHSRAWLRILAHELLPDFVPEFVMQDDPDLLDSKPVVRTAPGSEPDSSAVTDLSRLLAPGSLPPPMFPAPPRLEALGFPKHFANPAVVFPAEGLLLGEAQVGGVQMDVRISEADRSQHCYVLGATGTGKSTLVYNMICQDMEAGNGLTMVDPHGDLYEQCLAAVPKERIKDLILIDPSDPRFTPGLNPLDFNGHPDLVSVNRLANDMIDIFDHLYDLRVAGGPGFEEMFRNSLLVAIACPAAGPEEAENSTPTMMSIAHVLRDKDWREIGLSNLDRVYGAATGRRIRNYFESIGRTTGDHHFNNWTPYITSKLTRFVSNETLGKMICSDRRTIDFRVVMDQKKIVLVNLSKGALGGPDSRLVGMLLTKFLFHAATSRADVPREARTPHYFYLDEFQNFVCSDIDDILAEGRKFGLHLILANQTLGQLLNDKNSDTLDAVLGNVATKLFMRVGIREAASLEAGFLPEFGAQTLTQLPDRHVLCRLLVNNRPSLPFVFQTNASIPLPVICSAANTVSRLLELTRSTVEN